MNFYKIKTIIFWSRRLLGIAAFLLIWDVAPRLGLVDGRFIPPFSKVISTFFSLILSGELVTHILISLQRALLGFGLGLLVAIPLGLIIGWFKGFEFYMDPLLQTFRQTSTIALLPVFMFLFGLGESAKVAIVFWGVLWAILLNTISGVKSVDPLLIKSAKSMGASPLTMFIKVILPSAFPTIFTGIRLSATTSILILIVAEMLGGSKGLGFLLFDTEMKIQIPKMFAVIITISIIGLIVNYSLQAIEKRVTHWKEDLPTNGG